MKKRLIYMLLFITLLAAAQGSQVQSGRTQMGEADVLELPTLSAADLGGGKLKVVATTSIIGDVVAQVGGSSVELTTLMSAGQDPHSYEPAARDLTDVSKADVVFVNGWDLEEGLVDTLQSINSALLVQTSANIAPLKLGETSGEEGEHSEHESEHGGIDPHVWFSLANVEQWVETIQLVLSTLDPSSATTYRANADTYLGQLAELRVYAERELASIPEANRFLVSNHTTFAYFARDYNLELVGTLIPSLSTAAEPSAKDLAELISRLEAKEICTLFTETTLSDQLAQTVANELGGCDEVRILPLYTDALGPPGSGADSYLGMFKANVDSIVEGLR